MSGCLFFFLSAVHRSRLQRDFDLNDITNQLKVAYINEGISCGGMVFIRQAESVDAFNAP